MSEKNLANFDKVVSLSFGIVAIIQREKSKQIIYIYYTHDHLKAQTKLFVFIGKEQYLRRKRVHRLQTALLISIYRCRTNVVNKVT